MIDGAQIPQQLVIRASAGSGKTFQLSNRLLALYACGISASEVLATTFTKKAASEIRERVLTRLARAAISPAEARDLGAHTKVADFTCSQATELLKLIVENSQKLQIQTLDSTAVSIAKGFSNELGIEADWNILEEDEEETLLEHALCRVLLESGRTELLTLLQTLSWGDANKSVHKKLFQELRELLSLYEVTGPKAWRGLTAEKPTVGRSELLERLRAFEIPKTKSGTPNRNWEKAWNSLIEAVAQEQEAELLNNGLVVKALIEETKYSSHEISLNCLQLLKDVISLLRFAVLDENDKQTRALGAFLGAFLSASSNLKDQLSRYSFSDVKLRLLRLKELDNQGLLYRLDSKFSHILLDEFQDTALAEWSFLETFIDESVAQSDSHRSFFCIGDEKQAIYKWRGGIDEVFTQLYTRWPTLQGCDRPLSESYRSSPVIFSCVNEIFSALDQVEHIPKSVQRRWENAFAPHTSAGAALKQPGYVLFQQCEDELTALTQCADEVASLVQRQERASIGVLLRRSKFLPELTRLLQQRGITVSEESGSTIVDSAAISLFLSFLCALEHPSDTARVFHVEQAECPDVLSLSDRLSERRQLEREGFGAYLSKKVKALSLGLDTRDQQRLWQLVALGFEFDQRGSRQIGDFLRFVHKKRMQLTSPSKVRLMTIHQSKGLEFDAVFLPELSGRLAGSRHDAVLVSRRSPLEPPQQVLKYLSKEARRLDPRLEAMYEQELASKISEELSILYVAVTRARHALFGYLPGAKLSKAATHAAVVDMTFLKSEKRREIGDSDWHRVISAESPQHSSLAYPERVATFVQDPKKTRLLPRFRPHSSEHKRFTAQSTNFGEQVHRVLEDLSWFGEGTVDDSTESGKFVRQTLTDFPEIRKFFDRERYSTDAVIYREIHLAKRKGEALLSGTLDRLVVSDNGKRAEIIDFKTGSYSESTHKYHREQVRAYLDLVHQTFPRSAATAFILYLQDGTVTEVTASKEKNPTSPQLVLL